jgi:hypothetical protein
MAILLQSQTSGCCATPTGTIDNIPNAFGTLYLPQAQPSGTYCDPNVYYATNTPINGTNLYLLNVSNMVQTSGEFFIKVEVTTLNGCYKSTTYCNAFNAAAANGYGIKVKYPTNEAYVVSVYLQRGINSVCMPNQPEGTEPEWKMDLLMSGSLTWNDVVINAIKNPVTDKWVLKYNGMVPFGQNVLN